MTLVLKRMEQEGSLELTSLSFALKNQLYYDVILLRLGLKLVDFQQVASDKM